MDAPLHYCWLGDHRFNALNLQDQVFEKLVKINIQKQTALQKFRKKYNFFISAKLTRFTSNEANSKFP